MPTTIPHALNFNTNTGSGIVGTATAYGNLWTSTTSTSLVNISGLSITYTPTSASNIIYLKAYIPHTWGYVISFTFLKDGSKTLSSQTTSNNNETDCHTTFYTGLENTYLNASYISHYETAGSTSSRTYTVAGTSGWNGTAYTFYLHGRSGNDMQSTSWFHLMEVMP